MRRKEKGRANDRVNVKTINRFKWKGDPLMFIGRMLYLLLETSPTQSGARIIDQNVYMLFDVENLRNYTPVIDHRCI